MVEGGDEGTDETDGYEGMINEEKHYGFDVFFVFDGVKSDVKGREGTFFPVFVDEDLIGREAELGADFIGIATEDYASESDARVTGGGEQVFEEGEAAVGDQRFGTTHAAGFTGGENDGGDHWTGWSSLGSCPIRCHFYRRRRIRGRREIVKFCKGNQTAERCQDRVKIPTRVYRRA